ncbi:HNH endonuclease [Streptomyces bathyalis]|uniref:HNH endonuclease n=1 Tax=Streptomyces bathyalis TaxID=2710756 RepID=A0A7T1T8F6_9ACTN|nr:HNH endonuclease family protein [Streptomyces bathyalis]QPP08324.1 HNH endonuclease [Streptomyces bathyalis]
MRTHIRRGVLAALIAAGTTAVTLLGTTPAHAALPTPIAASTARSYLSSMPATTEHSRDGYSRDLFPHWINISGNCNTRETVLKRDGSGVVTDGSCAATSGSWYSPYDGATWTASSDVDIDHLIPLAEAWDSGAHNWSTSKRQDLANDLTRPQLLAVTDNVNQSKGDQDPGTWWPSRTAYQCTYARAWVQVKHYYGLTVDSAEKSALSSVLNGC